jgi:hypothetical protein
VVADVGGSAHVRGPVGGGLFGVVAAVAAGGDDPDAPGAAQECCGELPARARQVLTVVDEQQPAFPYLLDEHVRWRLGGVVVQPQRAGGGEREECRVVRAGVAREAHAVREGPLDAGRDTGREPGLADAARTGRRHQPCAGRQLAALGRFATPVDEAGRPGRQDMVQSWR